MLPMPRWNRSVWSAMAVAGLMAVPATAQTRANQGGGRALDANNQVGSGGTNRLENQVDYSARNDLITGNVAGGFGFQDDVGYSAPGAFLDDLGSEELFSFRAASLGSSPVIANLPNAGTIRGGNIVVYNNFTTIPTSRQINTPTRFAPTGGAFRVNREFSGTNLLELTLDRSSTQTYNRRFDTTPGTNTLGVLQVQDGTALAITADPLAGVRQRALPNLPEQPTIQPLPLGTPGLDEETQLPGIGDEAQNNLISISPVNSNNIFTQGSADNPGAGLRADGGFADSTGLVKPSLQLGQLSVNLANASPAQLELRVKQLQESIFGPETSSTPVPDENAEPENAYTQLLEEIREQAAQSAEERAASLSSDGYDPRPEWMKALDEPTQEEVEAAEGTLQATMDRIRSQTAARRGDDTESAAGESDAGTEALNELMDDLSYNVRLETLVAAREGRVNDLFAEAEQQMAAGQFLNAERTYRQIRIEAANNPLGLAGLIHAQLGAGMVRSAAFNLRTLFEDHPELIATRYGQNLLPPQERLEWLQKELQRMINTQSGAIDPGLMMAYLGYQIESRPLVRQGLAIAQNAAPIDPLLPVLRTIWLDQNPGEAAEAPAK
ncbi:hypothetical protein [Algisphaera agarilytica]|uniref:Uncharacterized protein n=1 Tax=Algisphaera agarilytica TaxID=1385975 RepID=A0A7X0LK47_9BACT|nr:hypothetical protein [Algisphaera agarilytica]MBB6429542.1 hypothetical protein [Algisphaera agarilytica]